MIEIDIVIPILLALLGSPSYHHREAAFCQLLRNPDQRVFLFRSDDVEVRLRLRHLREKFYRDSAESWYEKNKDRTLPWISNVESSKYLSHTLNVLTDDAAKRQWPRWRRATALYIRDKISEGSTSNEIDEIIRRFKVGESQWWTQQQPALPTKGDLDV